MLFNVSGLIQEGIGATRKHKLEGIFTREGHAPERVRGEIELLCTRDGVLVRANLHLVEPEMCSRCLNPLEETCGIRFEEEFHATADVKTGQHIGMPDDPDSFLIDSQHMLDLTEAVRQYREVSGAMQLLCRPDCRGLCPNCGSDLNLGDCNCDSKSIDPRWAELQTLRASIAEGKE